MATFESPTPGVVTSAVLEQCAIAEAQILNQTWVGIRHAVSLGRLAGFYVLCVVATDKSLVSFADDIGLATSDGPQR